MGTRMAPADAVWYLGENAVNPMTISSIMWFDGPLDVELLRSRITERLLDQHPILLQRIVPSRVPGRMPRWEDDPTFDLANHVTERTLPPPGDQAVLQDRCSQERTTPLDRSRPLWHISVLQGYRGEGSAVHVRIHHSIGDGLAMMQLLLTIVDEYDPDVELAPDRSLAGRVSGAVATGTAVLAQGANLALHPEQAVEVVRTGAELATWAGRLLLPQMVERTVLQGHPEGCKRMAWDPDGFPLEEVKHTARSADATINDLLMTVMSGGIHRYLAERDALVEDIAMMIPVNLRRPGDPLPRRLGNRIGLLPLRLPVGYADPEVRLRLLQDRMNELKRSPAPVVSRGLIVATTMLTPVVERGIHRLNQLRSTGVLTNVPGPREPLHIGGAALLGTMGWGGMTAHLNLSAAFISLSGRVFPGLVTDTAITPDPEEILAHLSEEYRVVREAVGVA
ncbi:MAG: wax ester/triacylglycerol synthase domain-containing protein [Nitriliruptoraceae bacterium]